MKKATTLLLLLFCYSVFAQKGFEGKIVYLKSIKKTESIKEKIREDFLYKMLFDACKNIKYELTITNHSASFSIIEGMDIGDNRQLEFATKVGGGAGYYYYNLKDSLVYHQQEFYDTTVIIKKKYNEYDWKLSNESKKIGNFLCYKATTSIKRYKVNGIHMQNIEAWYCPQWSLNYGPVGYVGLPGLIVELTDLGNGVSYQISKIYQSSYVKKPKKPIKGKIISLKQYDEWSMEKLYNYKN